MLNFKGIQFAPDFTVRSKENFHQAQIYVDSEVIRRTEPYIPILTGALKDSGKTGTKTGSGVVQYPVQYAKPRYYKGRKGKGLRGKYFFHRMKADHKADILRKVEDKLK